MASKKNQNDYIVLENINKIYPNNVQAVYDFSLRIKKHEFIVFVGPSGCGKSTTLRMVAGLEDITSGKLFIDSHFANDLTPKERDIAMVFQSYALYPQMSVYNNLAFGLRMRKKEEPLLDEQQNPIRRIDEKKIRATEKQLSLIEKDIAKIDRYLQKNPQDETYLALKEDLAAESAEKKEVLEYYRSTEVPVYRYRHYTKQEIDERVRTAAKILQIENYLFSKPSELSGGQRQRVALGRAIVRNAKVFLMDEPLSNLDAKLRVNMRSEIIELHRKIQATTIYVTHDQTEAMTMADRIVVMKDGYIQQIGTPKEIYNQPSNVFVATFIGSPAMNILPAEMKQNRISVGKELSFTLEKAQHQKVRAFYESQIEALKEEALLLQKEAEEADGTAQKKKAKKAAAMKLRAEEKAEENRKRIALYRSYLEKDCYDLYFGIRPEAILPKEKADGNISEEIALMVKIPELLGNEYYIHAPFGETLIVAKIQSKDIIQSGDKLPVVFDLDRINLFDRVSEKGIL